MGYTDYQLAESCKLQLDYSDEKSDFRDTDFPARYIYERLLPSVVGRLTDIHYHRSSPYSGFGKPTTDRTYGDLHQCTLSHDLMTSVALMHVVRRERLARLSGTVAQLGHPGRSLRV